MIEDRKCCRPHLVALAVLLHAARLLAVAALPVGIALDLVIERLRSRSRTQVPGLYLVSNWLVKSLKLSQVVLSRQISAAHSPRSLQNTEQATGGLGAHPGVLAQEKQSTCHESLQIDSD